MSRFDADTLARALAYANTNHPQVRAPDGMRKALEICAGLCRRFEGFYPAPYICPAGRPTIGYGATHYMDGRPVTMMDAPISRDAGERLLVAMLRDTYLPELLRWCPKIMDEPPRRVAALLDFTFNAGGGNLAGSTLRKRVNAGDWEGAKSELMKWTRGGGRVLKGLVARRAAECALI